jgi:myo-inositol 2-dehydrogenase/D-chiro-inositol 1-dehydrogenase
MECGRAVNAHETTGRSSHGKEGGRVRIGLIGLGRIGSMHAETLSGLDEVSSLVVTDVSPHAVAGVAARFPVQAEADAAAVLSAGIDGVVIAAATATHPALVRAAAQAGVPVFCEKPLAATAREGMELRDRLADFGVPIQIGFPRRFDAGFTAARSAVSGGELGWLHTVRSTTLDPAPPPASYVAGSGGIFRDCSVHDFDAVRWVTGREVVEVYATGSNRGDPLFAEVDDVDTASVIMTLDDETIALVSNTRYNARGYDVRMEVHGSLDSIAVGLDDRLPLRSAEPGATFPTGPPHVFFMDRFRDAFRAELVAFTQLVAGHRESPCTVDDALAASWIAEACILSRHRHRPVALAEVR